MIHLEFNSESENEGIARVVAAAYMVKFDPTVEEMADVKTAVSEAVTNSIVHAYDHKEGKVIFEISHEENQLCIVVEDFGIGIADVSKAMEPMYTTKPEEERTGMGFSFMEAFMDKVTVESKPGKGTKVTMVKEIGEKEALNG